MIADPDVNNDDAQAIYTRYDSPHLYYGGDKNVDLGFVIVHGAQRRHENHFSNAEEYRATPRYGRVQAPLVVAPPTTISSMSRKQKAIGIF